MKSSELRFEFNFVASQHDSENLKKLYELADTLESASAPLDELLESETISPSDWLDRYIGVLENIDYLKMQVECLNLQIAKVKETLGENKKLLTELEVGVPTKAKSAAKKVYQNREEFLKLLNEVAKDFDFDKFPMLKKIADKF